MKCILFIDDNVDLLEMLSEALINKGYTVITCNKSTQAMEKVKKYKPNLIVSDIQMPGMTGRDLVISLKEYDPSIPIVLLSAKTGMKDDVEFMLSKNIKAFLEKPCDLKKLLGVIEKIIPQSFSAERMLHGSYRDAIGKTVGNCLLQEIIGIGGTGIVYRGTHQGLNIPVAIKILSPSYYNDDDIIKRFLREAHVLACIEHPNIIQVLNADREEGLYFLIMRYMEGKSLFSLIQEERKLDYARASEIILKTARGLSYAHKKEVLHRDVKPSNILISKDEKEVKIIDFGLARKKPTEEPITQKGIVLGTPGYMSPEQCLDHLLDERTDVYSLGATFYESVTGQGPFGTGNIEALMAQLQGNFIPAHMLDHTIPLEISEVIGQMLVKDREKRLSSMDIVIERIESSLPGLLRE